MHRAVARQREMDARNKIANTAADIADKIGLSGDVDRMLQVDHLPRAHQDRTVRSVYEIESFANLLSAIAEKLGVTDGRESRTKSNADSKQPAAATAESDSNAESDTDTESESESDADTADSFTDSLVQSGLTRTQIESLQEAGYTDLDTLTGASDEDLAKVHGIGPATVGVIRSLSK
jgi:Mg-chelatase subunit ChlI